MIRSGAERVPTGWRVVRATTGQSVAGVMLEGDELTVTGDWGAERKLPLRAAWLGLGSDAVAAKKPLDWDL